MKCLVALGMIVCAVVLTDAFNPVGVAFKADNGKYLGRVNRGGINYIEAAKDHPDPTTRFLATESDGKLLLKADNGKYLSRIYRGGISKIEAAKDEPDAPSHFTVHNQPDGTVVLQANNGLLSEASNQFWEYLCNMKRGIKQSFSNLSLKD